jgi:hypothetical protein
LFDANADPDSTFHPDADPDPDPSFQIKVQTLAKCIRLIFHTFWLVTLQVKWQLGKSAIGVLCSVADLHHINADPDLYPDSTDHPDADPESDFYIIWIHNTGLGQKQ